MKFAIRTALITGAVLGCMLLTDGGHDMKAYADAGAKNVTMTVNQQQLNFNSSVPILESGTNMYVPIRPFAEQMNYSLDWRSIGNGRVEITIQNKDTSITFRTDDKMAEVNGESVVMPDSPWSYQDNTYISMRFLIDTLGLDYTWDPSLSKTLPSINRYAKSPAPSNSYQSTTADKIIHTAKSYLGVPYVWGGMSPSGFDCSGYVGYVFNKHGIELPRTAQQMYKSLGQTYSNPQKGDLVFFSESGNGITHVGISIGNDQYINAATGSANCVTISNLGSSWAKRTYVGAKRVL
ncbi:C40 family peptidase [Paenibacillus marinisediminis]